MNQHAPLPESDRLAPLWRQYWAERWHKLPLWTKLRDRQEAFLTAEDARDETPPVVVDYPTGRCPFFGTVTLSPRHDDILKSLAPSPHSGVLQFADPGHLLTIAPTRTGKGACHIVPNLLRYAGSAVVIDVKGENHAVTARARERMFPGARVITFAPFSDSGTARYNPMDFIRTSIGGAPTADTFDDARLLTEMLIPPKGKREDYWDIEARNLLTALILLVAARHPPGHPQRTLATVTALLFRPPEDSGDGDEPDRGYSLTIADMLETAEALDYMPLRALATALLDHEDKVRSGIVSTCRSEMRIWLSDRLQRATATSDFHFSDLKASMCRPIAEDPAPTTLYLVIPPEYLRVYRSVVRMMIGLAAVELTRPPSWSDGPGWRNAPPCPVLFMLDELPTLGHMSPIVDGLAYLAGYGVQLWSFAQNIGQLKEIYGEAWHNFPSNSAATAFFGVNDPDTADYIERLLGETPERMVYYQHAAHTVDILHDNGGMKGMSLGHRFHREKVISSAEIRALPAELQLVFIRNRPPVLATKLPYYEFEMLQSLSGRWDVGYRPA